MKFSTKLGIKADFYVVLQEESPDKETEETCEICDGDGNLYNKSGGFANTCETCQGAGVIYDTSYGWKIFNGRVNEMNICIYEGTSKNYDLDVTYDASVFKNKNDKILFDEITFEERDVDSEFGLGKAEFVYTSKEKAEEACKKLNENAR